MRRVRTDMPRLLLSAAGASLSENAPSKFEGAYPAPGLRLGRPSLQVKSKLREASARSKAVKLLNLKRKRLCRRGGTPLRQPQAECGLVRLLPRSMDSYGERHRDSGSLARDQPQGSGAPSDLGEGTGSTGVRVTP